MEVIKKTPSKTDFEITSMLKDNPNRSALQINIKEK